MSQTKTTTKERPIIFGADSICAILAGSKTQSRRLSGLEDVNERPDAWNRPVVGDLGYMTKPRFVGRPGATFMSDRLIPGEIRVCPQVCPFGRPGERLWCREVWTLGGIWFNGWDGSPERPMTVDPYDPDWAAFYRADGDIDWHPDNYRWRSPIFMPRWASRLTLQIESVRVERVQEISVTDAMAEGVPYTSNGYRAGFRAGWDALNARRGFGWDANPWVWVVSFKVVQP